MAFLPPGWFDDGAGQLRWWDGQAWTEHTAPLAPPTAPRPRRVGWWIAGGAAALVFALVAVVAVVGVGTWVGSVLDDRRAVSTDTTASEPDLAVEGLQEAFLDGDCDRMRDTTTPAFRSDSGWTDCGAFHDDVAASSELCEPGYELGPTALDAAAQPADTVRIEVIVTCSWNFDENGDLVDDPYTDRVPWVYSLVEAGGAWRVDEASDELQLPAVPADDSEASVAAVVAAYNRAWSEGDCAGFMAATSASLRELLEAEDCAAFDAQAHEYAQTMSNFEGAPTRFEHRTTTRIDVLDRETFVWVTDPDDPADSWNYEEYWSYSVELQGGAWVITDIARY